MAEKKLTPELLVNRDMEAWKEWLYNVTETKLWGPVEPGMAAAILQAGARWTGAGWNTSSASKRLWVITKLALVSSEFGEYLQAWLYACALWWTIEIPELQLSPKAVEAGFALLSLLTSESPDLPIRPEGGAREEVEQEEGHLPWEPELLELPRELQYVWTKARGGYWMDLKELLDQFPLYQGLPRRPPENNHKGDSKSTFDRQLRAQQQSLLHLLRMLTTVYSQLSQGIDAVSEFQMAFALTAELYCKMEDSRKESSITGSSAPKNDDEKLFGKEDLQAVNLQTKINGFRRPFKRCSSFSHFGGKWYSFRPYSMWGKSAKGKSKGGFKGGQGSRGFGGHGG